MRESKTLVLVASICLLLYLAQISTSGLAVAPSGAIPPYPMPTSTPTLTPTHTPTPVSVIYLPLILKGWLPPEFRGLWVDRWSYKSPDDIKAIVQKAAQANFNVIFFQVRGQGDAYYAPGLEPWAARLSVPPTLGRDPGWDPLQTAIDQAHAAGLELHAWVNIYPAWVGTSPPPTNTIPLHMYHKLTSVYTDTWRQRDDQSQPMPLNPSYLWASPGHPAVMDHILSVAQDLTNRYDVDGLHLDNIRYYRPEYSHDPVSEARFAEAQAFDPDLTWENWQRAQVTYLVGQIYEQAIFPHPGLMLTAAVWDVYQDHWGWIDNDGYDGYYQDSQGWMWEELIDGIAPMLYANLRSMAGEKPDDYLLRFNTLIHDFVAADNGRFALAGIYAGTSPSLAHYDDFSDIARSISLAREAGADGQVIFSYRLIEERDYWNDFLEGPYAWPSDVPPMPWKEK